MVGNDGNGYFSAILIQSVNALTCPRNSLYYRHYTMISRVLLMRAIIHLAEISGTLIDPRTNI